MLKKLFGSKEKFFKLNIDGVASPIQISNKESILQAALRDGIKFPHSCRVGGCTMCKCRLVSGDVKQLTETAYVLTKEELQQGYVLACQCMPKSDVHVEVDFDRMDDLPEHKLVTTSATITEKNALTTDIIELVVSTQDVIDFTPGQYAEISIPGKFDEPRAYSFASAGHADPKRLSFFIRAVPNGEVSNWFVSEAAIGDTLQIEAPSGDFHLRDSLAPMICIAGGSGLAPVLAILDEAIKKNVDRDAVMFFGARTEKDLYGLSRIEEIKQKWKGDFDFIPVLSEEAEDSSWQGKRGFVTEVFKEYCTPEQQIYMCGPPPMIDSAIEIAKGTGVEEKEIFFDKFLDRSAVTSKS
ncbi:MAG: 2Fe-2S iron-sulfur cluster binding domain-containing protein [Pseudomonadales bacterium]|nr:2Fe-2S iron-sulfur cluster binding domain-containing protein [Pseudomonadales bacterium]